MSASDVSLDAPPAAAVVAAPAARRAPLRFDRAEWSGAFGDLGTDLPLLVGMIVAAGLDPARVFAVYGVLQVATGVAYRMPMPVQPLKAVAAIVIAGGVTAPELAAGGLAIGLIMLGLAASGLLDRLQAWIPALVVRAIQLGLAIQLARLALTRFVPADGPAGVAVAALAAAAALALRGNVRVPPAFAVLPIGFAWATWRAAQGTIVAGAPVVGTWAWHDIVAPATLSRGLLVLALPQLALSLGNSVLATRRIALDLFPDRAPGVRRIGVTYAAMNLVSPWLGGVPVCHGSGGIAGHHAFGARSGGSVVLYGAGWLAAAVFAAAAPASLLALFPAPLLGALLLVEAIALARLLADVPRRPAEWGVVLTLALTAALAPYGYAWALVLGALLVPRLLPPRSPT
ncbi:MAG: putative sulfate/molybdate transporter [Gemmatimonadota bacterium]|nr:putative sulfate/molybdate transporter [Gemmatimonadota bacterium]